MRRFLNHLKNNPGLEIELQGWGNKTEIWSHAAGHGEFRCRTLDSLTPRNPNKEEQGHVMTYAEREGALGALKYLVKNSPEASLKIDQILEEHGWFWNDEKNEYRCYLIDKQIEEGLNDLEMKELAELQDEMLAYRKRVAPLPIEEAKKVHEELIKKQQEEDSVTKQDKIHVGITDRFGGTATIEADDIKIDSDGWTVYKYKQVDGE